MISAQEWLDKEYPLKGRNKIREINLKDEKLEGELLISNFLNLSKINVCDGKGITKLTITNCPKVEEILAYDNQIEEIIDFDKLLELKRLNFAKNRVKEINVSENTKLVYLVCHGNEGLRVKGLENSSQLSFLNGGWTNKNKIFFLPSLGEIEDRNKDYLIEIVEKLGVNKGETKDKTVEEIKKIISDKLEKMNKVENILQQVREEFKDLLNHLTDKKREEKELEERISDYAETLEMKSGSVFDYGKKGFNTFLKRGSEEEKDKIRKDLKELCEITKWEVINKIQEIVSSNCDGLENLVEVSSLK